MKDFFNNKKINFSKVNEYLDKINTFFIKIENKEYKINNNWLLKSLEELKEESIKYPNRIIIKYKYETFKNFGMENFEGKIRLSKK